MKLSRRMEYAAEPPTGARPSREELATLATAAARREPGATRTFIGAIAGTIRGTVRTVLGPENFEVDDVTQEATIGLLSALSRFRGECTVSQFARRVAVLTALASRRRQRTAARWVVADETTAQLVPAGSDGSPLAQVEAARLRKAVRRLLDELPDVLAETIVLYFMLGHTAEEIAGMTDVPVNTVWSRVRLGRGRLKKLLAQDPAWSEALARPDGPLTS